MAEVLHILTVGPTRIELNPDETRVVIKGDIPKRLAVSFEQRGITLPPRGTVTYHLEGVREGTVIFKSEAHMRRVT